MKKSIPKVRERESEASILGNDREREFPLTPDIKHLINVCSIAQVFDVTTQTKVILLSHLQEHYSINAIL